MAHQAYVHKMLTGRWDRIGTIHQYEGLNGFALAPKVSMIATAQVTQARR